MPINGEGAAPDPGKHNRYAVIAGVAAATLTLIAAIIGLVTVLVDDDGSSPSLAAPPVLDTSETGGGDGGDSTSGGNGGGSLDPARDGNSRATAKRLPANRPIYSSIAAGNDEDWYVYEAARDETVTVEVSTAGGDTASRLLFAAVFEGPEEIESSADVDNETEPLVLPRSVEAGARLFVLVRDICPELGGCSVGLYKVIVRGR